MVGYRLAGVVSNFRVLKGTLKLKTVFLILVNSYGSDFLISGADHGAEKNGAVELP